MEIQARLAKYNREDSIIFYFHGFESMIDSNAMPQGEESPLIEATEIRMNLDGHR